MSSVVITSCRGFLLFLSIVFLLLGIQMIYIGPIDSLAPHGLDVSTQPASALVEMTGRSVRIPVYGQLTDCTGI